MGRSTLVAGPAGSGKTLLGLQFVAEGAHRLDEPGVIVTFEESPEALLDNAACFGWPLQMLRDEDRLAFVDVSPSPGEVHVEAGGFDFAALQARILHAADRVGAKRVILDAIGTLFAQFSDAGAVRRELFRVLAAMRERGLTVMVTAERPLDGGPIARYGVEEFVTDNVILLRNVSQAGRRRRTLEVLKLRGGDHMRGEAPFVIDAEGGLTVLPTSGLVDRSDDQGADGSPRRQLSTGVRDLDEMLGGGVWQGSVVVVTGTTGAAKSVALSQFIGEAEGRGLLVSFAESRAHLLRNASRWGMELSDSGDDGRTVCIVARQPEAASIEEHLLALRRLIAKYKPNRIALDSVSALQRIAPPWEYRDFAVALINELRNASATTMLTATRQSGPATAPGISALEELSDVLLSMLVIEKLGRMHRAVAVIKMRGADHDQAIREVLVGDQGIEIGETFSNVQGILGGRAGFTIDGEAAHYGEMFSGDR